jgi:hypothetical protein
MRTMTGACFGSERTAAPGSSTSIARSRLALILMRGIPNLPLHLVADH